MADDMYIVDVRKEFRGDPYITLWRPNNAGFAYPTSWAGRYTPEQIAETPAYYYKFRYRSSCILDRYPVPCAVVDAMGIEPAKTGRDRIDNDAGLVIRNTAENRAKLRRNRVVPDGRYPA